MGRLVDLNDDSLESIMWRHQMAEAQRHEMAVAQHKTFLKNLEIAVNNLKISLGELKKPAGFNVPNWLLPYSPSLWCELSFPPKDWLSPEILAMVIVQKAFVPEAIQNVLDTKIVHGAWYIPRVLFETITPPPSPRSKGHPAKPGTGVPCLKWLMDTYIRTHVEFWLTDKVIIDERDAINRWKVTFEPENLGEICSKPEFWKCQTTKLLTPLSLLLKVGWGKGDVPGVETIRRVAPWTIYAVEGFLGEITLHDDFCLFIRDMAKKSSLVQALLDRQMCDVETVGLVKAKLEKLKETEAPAAVPQKADEPEKVDGAHLTEAVVDKLTELGWTQDEAADAISSITFPADSTVDEMVKLVISQ